MDLVDVLAQPFITKNAKLQLPASVFAAEFTNYDPDAVVDPEPVVQKKGRKRHSKPDFVLPVKSVGAVYDTSGVYRYEIVNFGYGFLDS